MQVYKISAHCLEQKKVEQTTFKELLILFFTLWS